MENYALLVIGVLAFSFSFAQISHGQANDNLQVSAENELFENHFAGPMIIEVTVDDSDISSQTRTAEEPNVTVDNNKLRMVQSDDGKWRGYFGDRAQIQLADSLVGLAGHGLDFGEMCQNTSAVTGAISIRSSGIVIPKDIEFASNGDEGLGTCNSTIEPSDETVSNVLRNTNDVNTRIDPAGQIGVKPLAWPFIQLYDFDEGDGVKITYDKGGEEQTVDLVFSANDRIVKTEIDGEYRSGKEIKIMISNPFLNIDPTSRDSWTWSSGSTEKTFYMSFDEDGRRAADGTEGHVDVADSSLMWFGEHGRFSINPNVDGYERNVLVLQDNKITVLEDIDGSNDTPFDFGTASIRDSTEYPITFVETAPNSGIFVNYDDNDRSNLRINDDIPNLKRASFGYSGETFSVLVESGNPPVAVDDRVSTTKGATIDIDVLANDSDAEDNELIVSLGRLSIEGTVKVSENNTLTYTAHRSFIGTDTFDYTIDDVHDGTDTATVRVDINPDFNPGSIKRITVYSDKSEYVIGQEVKANWVISEGSLGTDTTVLVMSPIGTTAVEETVSNGTEYSISTDDFTKGEHTVRIEHGQYYGEKRIQIKEPTQTAKPSSTSEKTDDTARKDADVLGGLCSGDSKISTSVSKSSYVRDEKISVSLKLCGAVSDEYVTVRILDPFNNPINLDQFLPKSDGIEKQYTTGKAWRAEGEYTVKGTYLGSTTETTFDFVAKAPERDTPAKTPPKEVPKEMPKEVPKDTKPTQDTADAIAPFVDPEKEPQHYIDRYNKEPEYKAWFEKNYPQYDSIYDAVGLDESETGEDPTVPQPAGKMPQPDITPDESSCGAGTVLVDGICQLVRETADPSCGAGTVLVDGICQLVRETADPSCGAGTVLVDGICQINKTEVESSKTLIDEILGFFNGLLNR